MTSPAINLVELIRLYAASRPHKLALCQGDAELSYGDLYDRVLQRSRDLREAGSRAGDPVMLRAENAMEDVINLLACTLSGISPLLVSSSVPPAEEQSAVCSFVPKLSISNKQITRYYNTEAPVGDRAGRSKNPVVCLLTSGVTGRPKVVAVDWLSCTTVAHTCLRSMGITDSDTVLCTTPIAYSYGLCVGIIGPLSCGSTSVLPKTTLTALSLQQTVNSRQITVLQSVPFYYRLVMSLGIGLPGVRFGICAGEPLPADLAIAWANRGLPPLYNHYGASEVGQISTEYENVPNSVGRVIEGCQIEIRHSLREGQKGISSCTEGEVWVKAQGRPSYYVGVACPEDQSLNDGWFNTGDMGFLDGEGRLILTGRFANRIYVAGKKVDPSEVEQTIRLFPGVIDCAVIGLESRWAGQEVCALIRSIAISEASLLDFLRSRLSDHKVPRIVRHVDEIPRTQSGKIRYGLLTGVPGRGR